MDKRNCITLNERKKIQLEMLDEIHEFCLANNIRYSLAFGTLLGAIRHKGFIPWDDDVDIMMPLPDLLKFKRIFKSDRIQYNDVDTNSHHQYPFSILSDKESYLKDGLILRTNGVSIDLYICVGLPDDVEMYFKRAKPLFEKRMKFMKWRAQITAILPIKTIPFFSMVQKKYRNNLLNNSVPYQDANKYYVIAAPINEWKTTFYSYDLFGKLVQTQFEGRQYLITSFYDEFLTLRYGDYMKLPPVEQQRPSHGGKYFWK